MPDPPPSLDPVQLGAYFALIEVAGLLRHAVEQQLREAGDLSYVQFQLLARLGDSPTGSHRMTDLADGVVYSRSGLTYQAGLLEKAGPGHARHLAGRRAGRHGHDHRRRARLLAKVLPGHAEVISSLLFEPLSRKDAKALAGLLAPVRDHMRSTPPRSAAPRRRRVIGTSALALARSPSRTHWRAGSGLDARNEGVRGSNQRVGFADEPKISASCSFFSWNLGRTSSARARRPATFGSRDVRRRGRRKTRASWMLAAGRTFRWYRPLSCPVWPIGVAARP